MASGTTITKKEIIDRIVARTGVRRNEVRVVVQEVLDEIVAELGRGHRLEFRDFGVFEVKERAARTAQNPKTLEPVLVPAKRAVKFKPGRRMKDILETPPGDALAEVKVAGAALDASSNGLVRR